MHKEGITMSRYKKKKKRSGQGTGQACMGLNISDQKDCPFIMYDEVNEAYCNINYGKDCDLDTCKLKEYGRIIVEWVE